MVAKEPIAILFSEVDQHPAALAWQQLNYEMAPQAIEVLQKQRKSEIYRLLTGIAGEESIIAKRCVISTGKLEKVIYEEILPSLSISQLHYYGSFQETDSYMWLFLADAGKTLFSTEDASHRVLGAHWLGTLHRFAQKTRAAEVLPERGVSYYFALMQSGREIIIKNLANSLMTPTDIDVLQRVLTQMDTLESNWSSVLKVCESIPQTLAHGDFRPKNVHVKQTSTGNAFYAMDWEMAGWGNPVVDLAPARGVSSEPQVDPHVYISRMQEVWPGLDGATLGYFVQVGCIFRRLAAIYWAGLELSPGWVEGPIYNMKVFQRELSHAMGIVLGREP
jgi:hypothetical protein